MREITHIGKDLRDIRLRFGESSRDMAKKLHMSPSMLSSMEHGRKGVSPKILQDLKEAYNLTDEEIEGIKSHVNSSESYVMLNISNQPEEKKKLAIYLSENYSNIPMKEIKGMMRALYLL